MTLTEKHESLRRILKDLGQVVVAYSGGEKGKEQAALFVKSLGERAGKHP